MGIHSILSKKTRLPLGAMVALVGFCVGTDARAGMVLDLSSDVGASVEFKGTGAGATFKFNNNQSGDGLDITSSSGVGDAVGLQGSIAGSFSYTTASITTLGPLQMAPVATSGGLLTLTDGSGHALTGTITGVDLATVGTGGTVNVEGSINLTNVIYAGANADLTELKHDANLGGGAFALTFQFVPAESLSQLAASGSDHSTSYSGTIMTAVPEPSSLVLGCVGAVGLVGYGLRRCKLASAGEG
jgi:hypothetical protein